MSEVRWADRMLIYDNCICQYFGRKYPACAKCVEACPHDALKAGDETIEIDPQKCTQCGDCISVCPSGAISLKGEFADTLDLSKYSEAAVVFCEKKAWKELSSVEPENIKPIFLEHIGVLSESDLAVALSLTGGPVVLLASEEGDRERAFVKAAEFVGEITKKLFGRELIFVFSEKEKLLNQMKDIVSIAKCSKLHVDFASELTLKRETFNAIVGQWIKKAGDLQEGVIGHPAYATIKCDRERCILCGACANQCRVKALRMTDDNRALSL
ncbi:MAG: 4Fe-4S binding protein, partial [Planctomycetota bacterium]